MGEFEGEILTDGGVCGIGEEELAESDDGGDEHLFLDLQYRNKFFHFYSICLVKNVFYKRA